ncbi:hypothetical protein F2Q70_00027848 [Brassica cretica]|uniref:No apical meristem-associated C-terminal domain-containing protein n=1 Tax=Brassica cretica TaxID=69181 RepID=A0A8S9IHX8_BRACR|nr:hypothetical protein F2Q68_00027429 [Brassica cretica]KAF2603154.1 hypothetical protein F2Q70_00027848 [Brassica cretica]
MMISPDGSDDDDHSSSVSLSTAHLDDESLHLSLRPGGLLDKRKGQMDRSRDEGSSNKTTTIAIQICCVSLILKCNRACSEANETDSGIAYEGTTRPTGVKAAKARGKKPMGVAKDMSQFQTMWTIKQQDLAALKEKISKMRLLDSNGKEEEITELMSPCNNRVMGVLITIKATYHVPF